MRRNCDPFLVAALSGRALAHSAHTLSIPVIALDVFGDTDTRCYANAWARAGEMPGGIERTQLLAAAERYSPAGKCSGLVYGSGFESSPELLSLLSEGRPLFGNSPDTLAEICRPQNFFAVLDRLGIPCPAVSYRPPANPNGWLGKRAGACGGGHVKPAYSLVHKDHHYFQRRIDGDVASVLFLANGRDARILGVSEQWNAGPGSRHPYLYGGAVSHRAIRRVLHAEILVAVQEMVKWWGLRGLNGIDLIINGEDFYVLELNARPTATVELYEAGGRHSFFDAHIQACKGHRLPGIPTAERHFAHMPVYAVAELRVPAGFMWPGWCSDLSVAGTCIRHDEPVCTVHASGRNPEGLRDLLRARARYLSKALLPDECVSTDSNRFGGLAACLH